MPRRSMIHRGLESNGIVSKDSSDMARKKTTREDDSQRSSHYQGAAGQRQTA